MKQREKLMQKWYIVFIGLVLAISSSHSDNKKFLADPLRSTLSYLRLPVSARVAALGGAVSSHVKGYPAYSVVNPALISKITLIKLEISKPILTLDRKHFFISGLYPFTNYEAAIGAGWINYTIDEIEERTNNGVLIGNFSDQENTFFINVGMSLLPNFGVGLTAKYHMQSLYETKAQGFSGDIGCFYQPWELLTIAFVCHSLGTKFKWDNGHDEMIYPGFRFGASTLLFSDILGISADCEWTPGNFPQIFGGIECQPLPWVTIMTGAQAPNPIQFSGGIDFSYKFLSVQYAFVYHKAELGHSHIITLGFEIGRGEKTPTYNQRGPQ